MNIWITKRVEKYIDDLHGKDSRIVSEHIDRLVDHPHARGDIERLNTPKERYRMHISYRYTLFFYTDGEDLIVNEIMTTEEAHKRYGRI